MWKAFWGIMLTLSIVSCVNLNGVDSEAQIRRPSNLIEAKKMTDILTEVSVIEGSYAIRYVQIVRYADQMAKDVEEYLKTQGVTEEQFKESIRYYSTQSNEWIEMQEIVKKNLELKLSELPAVENTEVQEIIEVKEIESEP